MSNNLKNLKNIVSMPERVLSALAYFTGGMLGIILIVASVVMKVSLKPFVKFNCYQAILLGFIFAFVQLTYLLITSILQILAKVPILDILSSFVYMILYYIMGMPVLFGRSLVALIIIALILYLAIVTLIGKSPYIPYLSDAIKRFM